MPPPRAARPRAPRAWPEPRAERGEAAGGGFGQPAVAGVGLLQALLLHHPEALLDREEHADRRCPRRGTALGVLPGQPPVEVEARRAALLGELPRPLVD